MKVLFYIVSLSILYANVQCQYAEVLRACDVECADVTIPLLRGRCLATCLGSAELLVSPDDQLDQSADVLPLYQLSPEGSRYRRSVDSESNNDRKKRSSFVRIGRLARDDEKRSSSFVRVGKAYDEAKRAGSFVRIGKALPGDEKRSSFVRIGKSFGNDPNGALEPDWQKRSSFVRIGKSFDDEFDFGKYGRFGGNHWYPFVEEPPSKNKRTSSFVRIGKSGGSSVNEQSGVEVEPEKRTGSFVRIGRNPGEEEKRSSFVRIGRAGVSAEKRVISQGRD